MRPQQSPNADTPSAFTGYISQDQFQQVMRQYEQRFIGLQEQVQQHASLLERLSRLESRNQELESQNQQLANQVAQLQSQLNHRPADSASSPPVSAETTNRGTTLPTAAATPTMAQVVAARHMLSPQPRSLKKRVASARAFRTTATQGEQGYAFVYLGRTRKISRSEVRAHLRGAGVDTSRIIDICFPASQVIGILLHVQYKDEFISTMTKAEAEIITDFDPTDPAHLADPKYLASDVTDSDRLHAALDLNFSRCKSTLKFIRPVLVPSVARFFVQQQWLDDSDLPDIIRDAAKRLHETNPRQAAFAFRRINLQDDNTQDNGSHTGTSDMDMQ